MRLLSLVVYSTALLIAAPAAAKTNQAPSASSDSTKAQGDKICKRLAATGTRIEKRVCLTKDEWKKVEEI